MPKRVAIGIDLGTTNSCVGVFRNGKVEIVENDLGHRITPSQVAFDGTEVHVGEAAQAQAAANPKNTVFEVKRLIGRRFKNDPVEQDMKWPFEVFDEDGAPKIRVQCNEERKVFSPEQISAMVLKRMKHFAERVTNVEIQDAVITVPAYFNDSQRQATIDAGKIAGLNVLSIINEPTAAALAYGYTNTIHDQTVLVFDFGGGTFDVSIISIGNKNFTVKAVGGNTHLGGADFNLRLVNHFLEIAKQKHNKDLSTNIMHVGRLRESCEKAKILLSTPSGLKATVTVHGILDGEDFQEIIYRSKFEQLCMDLFTKTIDHVKIVLTDAGMNKSDIDEVILVGGSTRIPKIQELLSKFFDGKKLNVTINPDEAVAYGAAVKAALASGMHTIEDITLADVVPLSLGLRDDKTGAMKIFIKRNSRIPITVVQKTWTTDIDYQTSAFVNIYEGERKRAKDNNVLGTFEFDIGECVLAFVPRLTFTFEVDVNGILHVSGVNERTRKSAGITFTKGLLKTEQIEGMVQETKQLRIT